MHRLLACALLLLMATPALPANEEAPSLCRVGVRWHGGEKGGQLLGEVLRTDIENRLPDWDADYAGYAPSATALKVLAAVDEPLEIICVLGTWCHDSEREVPRFWKILDEAANPNLVLTMFAVGRTADVAADEVLAELGFEENPRQTYGAEYVPTFVFLKDGLELGRIIETPTASLEEDAAALLDAAPAAPVWR